MDSADCRSPQSCCHPSFFALAAHEYGASERLNHIQKDCTHHPELSLGMVLMAAPGGLSRSCRSHLSRLLPAFLTDICNSNHTSRREQRNQAHSLAFADNGWHWNRLRPSFGYEIIRQRGHVRSPREAAPLDVPRCFAPLNVFGCVPDRGWRNRASTPRVRKVRMASKGKIMRERQ